ncbi:MAG: flagellar hook-associated protein 2 [Pseudohongiellaceae bacterium]
MAIAASGIGSGIDILGLVDQLVNSSRARPEQLLDDRESKLSGQISSIGTLKSAISTFQDSLEKLNDPASFLVYSGSSSDETVATLTAGATAQPGTFGINVTQLAVANKVSTTAFADSDTTAVGTGNLTVANANGDSFMLSFAGSGDNTLDAIAKSINDASDNFGVTATVINIDDGIGGFDSKLVITANETGEDYALTLTADPSLNALDNATGSLANVTTAKNAIIEIDGVANVFTSQSNKVTGAIDGVTLDLVKLGTTTAIVAADQDGIVENVEAFVDSYNKMIATFNIQTAYNDGEAGPLFSDATIRSLRSQITTTIADTVPSATSSYNSLSALGITTNDNGELSLDSAELKEALDADFDSVSIVFTATDGIATRLDTSVEQYTKFAGLLDSKKDSLNTRLDLVGDARERLEYRIGKMEARLTAQFIAMDGLLASLNSTGSFLTQQLANLPGFTRPK